MKIGARQSARQGRNTHETWPKTFSRTLTLKCELQRVGCRSRGRSSCFPPEADLPRARQHVRSSFRRRYPAIAGGRACMKLQRSLSSHAHPVGTDSRPTGGRSVGRESVPTGCRWPGACSVALVPGKTLLPRGIRANVKRSSGPQRSRRGSGTELR